MNTKNALLKILILVSSISFGQTNEVIENTTAKKEDQILNYRHSVGSSLFMLGNFLEESPDYVLLTYGYRLNQKDRVFVEFNTWKYAEPLGTYTKSEEFYPGFVRAWGLGLGYQRFHWKGLFTTIQATSFLKQYYDIDDQKTQKGFQRYLQLVAGYRFEFINKRFFIEPALALKYWPIDTNFPTDFAAIEAGTPKYIFEPSCNIGFKF